MTYVVRESFQARSGEIRKGQIVSVEEDKAQALLKAGKIAEIQPCGCCGAFSWWLSTQGVLTCGACHPPATQASVRIRIVRKGGRTLALVNSGSGEDEAGL
jgi:hypothetical protein